MTRQTLGELMGRTEETESQVAPLIFFPLSQNEGLGERLVRSTIVASTLNQYASSLLSENALSPTSVISVSPRNDTGVLSTANVNVYTTPERFVGDTENTEKDPIRSLESTSAGFFRKDGASASVDRFQKNSSQPGLPADTISGHDLLAKEGTNPVPPPRPGAGSSYRDEPGHYEIRPDESTRPIAAALHDTLVELNKYTPTKDGSPFLDYGEPGELAFVKGLYSVQRELGSFDPQAETFSIAELRKIAGELLFKAQSIDTPNAERIATQIAKEGNFGRVADTMALFPHLTQTGQGTINTSELRARIRKGESILEGSGQNDLLLVQGFRTSLGLGATDDPVSHTLLTAQSATSHGTMNSPVEQFGGPFPAGMAMPVVYALVIVGLFGQLLPFAIKSLKDTDLVSIQDPKIPSTMMLGRNVPASSDVSSKMLELLGMPRTTGGAFFGPMMAGLMLFYGLQAPITPFATLDTDLLNSALNLLYAPGYYLVMTKGVLRDIGTITNTLANFETGSGVLGIITSFFNSIETILRSYTFRFFMIMAQVGAQAMRYLDSPGLHHAGGKAVTYDQQKETENLTGQMRMKLSRFHGADALGLRKPRSPLSLTLFDSAFLPTAETGRSNLMPSVTSDAESLKKIKDARGNRRVTDAVNRLTPEMVDAIEKQIDGEYMPFSIQDLRTNEIFSLPAFIISLSDDFSIQHGNTHGYGRTDPVMSYSKTTRSVNVVFELVSMSPQDHIYMYHIVNKLVAMCYPQRDMGLIRKQGKGPDAQYFVQPFSQTPIASPVIRLRVGDLIRSNRSKFALEKLFGGAEVLQQKGEIKPEEIQTKIENVLKNRAEFENNYEKARLKKVRSWNKGHVISDSKGAEVIIPKGTSIYVENKHGSFYTFTAEIDFKTKSTDTKVFKGGGVQKSLRNGGKTDKDTTAHQIELPTDRAEAQAIGGKALVSAVHYAEKKGGKFSLLTTKASGLAGYIVPGLGADPMFTAEMLGVTKPETAGLKTLQEVKTFLSEEKNPIARSFMKGTPGKGMAAVITQLSFGYDGNLWGSDEGENGLNAPRKIQVTMALSPIHDAPLGLDAQGRMFAPSHPVGMYQPSSKIATKPIRPSPDSRASGVEEAFKQYVKQAKDSPIPDHDLGDPTEAELPGLP